MSFGGFLDTGSGGGGGGGGARVVAADIPYAGKNDMAPSSVIAQPRLLTPSLSKSMFNNSPGLSLALQTGIENQQMGESYEQMSASNHHLRRSREEEHESRSGSDNLDGGGASGDDQDASADNPPRKKRYHRHTPQQIQELEALFKECPHPDEKQRLELSKRLSLETRQVKFWFQNRRTQMKVAMIQSVKAPSFPSNRKKF